MCHKKRLTLTNQSYFSILAGVTRIELASAVLETVALPLCYTPIIAPCYYYINKKNNHQKSKNAFLNQLEVFRDAFNK